MKSPWGCLSVGNSARVGRWCHDTHRDDVFECFVDRHVEFDHILGRHHQEETGGRVGGGRHIDADVRAGQVVRHLAAKLQDDDGRVGVVFDIDLVEDAVGWGLDEMPSPPEKKKPTKGGDLPHAIGGLMSSLDAMELLAALELTETQKLVLIMWMVEI